MITDLTLLAQRTMIENGLAADSDLVKSVVLVEKNGGLQLLALDYYEYVSTGRRPKARKVPVEDLIVWIKSKGIGAGNINNMAFAIQQSIYKRGIKGKAFANPVENNVADLASEELAELLSEVIADDMVDAFKPLTK
jgi:hypothetical protein